MGDRQNRISLPASCNFVRILWCDASGIRRCRVVPRTRLLTAMRDGVGVAYACMFLPSFGDCPPRDPAASAVGEMRLLPDTSTLRVLPWNPEHAMCLATLCTAVPTPWDCCPRTALASALRLLLNEAAVGLRAAFEVEFTLLQQPAPSSQAGLTPVDISVYCQSSSYDAASPVLDEMCGALEALGDEVEQVHAESAGGQFELSTRHGEAMAAADALIFRKEAIAGVARRHQLVASFLPKLAADQAGNGCHCHFSLCGEDGQSAMGDTAGRHGLSQLGEWFAAGVLRHLPALMAFISPSANSYRRIAPSMWSGCYHCWGVNNREAALRLTWGCPSQPGTIHFELKTFDGTCNPHLGLVGLVAAGLLGIRNRLELPAPVTVDPASLDDIARGQLEVARLPATLEEAVHAAEADSAFLAVMREAVGGQDLVRAYLAVKRSEWEHFKGLRLEEEAAALHARF